MSRGGPRPNSGRPRGVANVTKLNVRLNKARDYIAEFSEKYPDFNPLEQLREFALNAKDEALAIQASIMIARLATRPLAPSEERVELHLPEDLSTPEAVSAAIDGVLTGLAGGHIPRFQGEALLRGLALKMDAIHSMSLRPELDALRQEVKRLKGLPAPEEQPFTVHVVGQLEAAE